MTDSLSKKFDVRESLLKTIVFKDLDDHAYDHILNVIYWKQYRPGMEVIPYKNDSDEVYFIASGQVRITIFSFSGKEITYQELGPAKCLENYQLLINCLALPML